MKKIFLFSCLALTVIASCKKGDITDNAKTIVLPANGQPVINANNQFAFNFLQATLQQDLDNNNKLISPLSIYLALSMVYNGTDNATKDSIAKTLQLSGIDINDLNNVCQALITQLPGEDGKVRFSIANSIWYNQNSFQPLPSFLSVVKNYYDATVQPLNFSDDGTTKTINNWVAQKTNNKIPSVIDAVSPDDLMYLINAIYFNGSWQHAFKTSDTYTGAFHLQDGSTKDVSFMNQKLTTKVVLNNSFTMIELPYGGGKSYSMYVVLPNEQQQPISTFASLMNGNLFKDAVNNMDSASIQLHLPKWEYSYNIDDMRPGLSMLGMGIAFGGGADFSKMYDPSQVNPSITKAIHKTYIKVNEEGTEAAAVTAIGIGTTATAPPPVLKIDRPFLYAIVEKQTGAILFVGIVNDPS